jgi:transcription elongation factor Elf1
MDICAGCGVIAPRDGSACTVCSADFAESRTRAAARTDDAYWVAVRCRFQCRSCGHLSPLNHLDMDGTVVCLRCGLSQIFDVASWDDGLNHAHAVGDLAGPELEGRHPNARISIAERNPFKDIGRTHTSAELAQSGMRIAEGMMHTQSLRVEASPGQPLCDHCRRPLNGQLVSQTRATAGCVACGTTATYELPERALPMCASIKAVIAEEQSTDRRDAKIDEHGSGGAVAIRCPNCDAALSVTGTSQIVTCEYCKASARIPSATLHQLGFADPQPLIWWMLFAGRSRARDELEQEQQRPEPTPRVAPISLPRKHRPSGRRKRPHPANPVLALVIPLLITGAVGWFAFGDHLRGWAKSTPAPVARPEAEWVELQGCACGEPRAQLSADVVEIGSGKRVELDIGLRMVVNGQAVALPSTKVDERRLGIGLACDGDRIIVATGETVSAWSLSDGRALWIGELRKAYRYSGKRADSGLSAYCEPMRVKRGEVRVPRGKTGHARIRIDDGSVRKK